MTSRSFSTIVLVISSVVLMALPGTLGTRSNSTLAPAGAPAVASSLSGSAMLLAAQASLDHRQGPAAYPRSANGSGASNWSQVNMSSATPGARQLFSMAYDPTDGYVVLFGGGNVNTAGGAYNDTWTFRAGNWTELFPSVAPSIRRSSSMVWDAADGYLLLFSGLGASLRDTWGFVGGVWTDRTLGTINNSNTPSTRWNAQMGYDPAVRAVVLFGGCFALACAASTNDTWEYQAGTWSNVTSTAGAAPSDRGTSSLVWYPPDQALFLFGGSTPAQTVLGDTWEFGVSGWVQLTPLASPPARGDQWMVFDIQTGYMLMFGGLEYAISPNAYAVSDTWTYQNGTWTNETSSNSIAPPSIWGEQSAGVWDGADQCGLLFGGADTSDNNLAGTWGYGCLSFGNGTGGGGGSGGNCCTGNVTGNWTIANFGGASSPGGRDLMSMAYDPVDQYVVLFGGGTGAGPGVQYNDTWTFRAGNWTELFPPIAPAARRSATLAWDAADGYLVLFGGIYPWVSTNTSVEFQDTWSFVNGTWQNRTAVAINASNTPSARWNAQMAYDPSTTSVVLFGGCDELACAGATNDTWSYAGGSWTNITASVGAAPSVRGTAELVWYPADSALFLFGGSEPNQSVTGDTWELGGLGWTELSPATAPASRGDYWMTYDPSGGYVLLFGGLRYSVSPSDYALSDTWIYANGTWTNETLNNPSAPPALYGEQSAGTFDVRDGYAVLFGGFSANNSPLDATWVYTPRSIGNGSGSSSGTGGGGSGGSNNSSGSGNPNGSSGTAPGGSGLPEPAPPFTAAFHESVTSGRAPLLVDFVATPSGGTAPFNYAWNFGDGTTGGNVATVSHTYTAAGNFQPVVTITDAKGVRLSTLLPAVVVGGRLASAGSVHPILSANLVIGSLLAGGFALVGAALILNRRRAERLRQEGELFLLPPIEP